MISKKCRTKSNLLSKLIRIVFGSSRKVSKELLDLIYQMLKKDPKQRIKMNEIKKHPFMV